MSGAGSLASYFQKSKLTATATGIFQISQSHIIFLPLNCSLILRIRFKDCYLGRASCFISWQKSLQGDYSFGLEEKGTIVKLRMSNKGAIIFK